MAADNVIEVILQSQDAMSKDLAVVEQRLRGIEGASAGVSQGTALVTHMMDSLHRQLIPVHQAVGTVTNAVARLHPEFGVLISASDNLIFSMVRAGSTATGFTGAMAAMARAALNPVTLGVLGLVTALGYLIPKFLEAREAKEKFDKALASGSVGLLTQQLEAQRIELNKINQQIQEAATSRQFPGVPPDLANIDRQRIIAKLTGEREQTLESINKLEKSIAESKDVEIQRLINQVELETKLLTVRDRAERDRLTVAAKVADLELQKFSPEGIAAAREAMANQARVKREQEFTDLLTKNREEWIKGWEEDLGENFPQAYQQAMEVARKADIEAQRRQAELAGVDLIGLESRRSILVEQLQRTKDMEGPMEAILGIARQIDAVEADIARRKIEQLETQAKLLEAEGHTVEAARARAQAEAIRAEQAAGVTKTRTEAERLGGTIADGILTGLRGGKEGILDFMANLGRDMARKLLADLFAGLLQGKGFGGGGGFLSDILGGLGGFGGLGGIFDFFGGGGGLPGPAEAMESFGFLTELPALFGHGGMVVPHGAMRKFQHGGMVRNGPVMGVVGEEGPELVARMKPARPGADDGKPLVQNIFLVDQRPPRLGPNDVVLIVSDNMQHGGAAAKAVKNVVKQVQ